MWIKAINKSSNLIYVVQSNAMLKILNRSPTPIQYELYMCHEGSPLAGNVKENL